MTIEQSISGAELTKAQATHARVPREEYSEALAEAERRGATFAIFFAAMWRLWVSTDAKARQAALLRAAADHIHPAGGAAGAIAEGGSD